MYQFFLCLWIAFHVYGKLNHYGIAYPGTSNLHIASNQAPAGEHDQVFSQIQGPQAPGAEKRLHRAQPVGALSAAVLKLNR